MYSFIKRVFDVVASSIALLVLSPIWIVTIIGIEINDFGPVFFKADRIGKNNKEFKMLKFRSMRVSTNQEVQTLRPEESRIFAWGKIIRKLKIDELPQLWNVFIGDMSVVGPRPVAPSQIDLFRIGKYDEVKNVRPGLSGPAAIYDYIYGDQFEDTDEKLYIEKVLPTRRELEYVYVKKQGIVFDIKMIFWTVWAIICSIFGKMPKKMYNCLVEYAVDSEKTLVKQQ
ncbi:MAG: sugar transferase [Bacteroidia bacterium]|nr:sugar transferase [Bacteroidia bacterium]